MATARFVRATALTGAMAAILWAPCARAAEGGFTGGTQWWDQSAQDAKFQEFREVPRGLFLESFALRDTTGRNDFAVWGANAIRRDQTARLRWNNGARWRMDLGYRQIPHTFSQLARWGWLQASPGTFTLPDSLQIRNETLPAGYTARMNDFLKNAPRVGLDFRTNVTQGRLRLRPAQGWTFETQARLTKRSGLKPYAMSFGFNTAVENPEPIDQRMIDGDVIAGYSHNRFTARATAGVSVFDNKIGELRVDNPRRLTSAPTGDGTGVGQLDLYPDNRVLRGTAEMDYRLADYTSLSAMFGLAQGKQDDAFLPFTINSTLPQSNPDSLPARSLDAKTTELVGDARLRSRLSALDYTLRFHYVDNDNRTEELNFIGQTPYESGWQRYIELENGVVSTTRSVTGVDLDWAVIPGIRLGGTAEYRLRERTDREVEKDNETVLGARVRLQPGGGLGLRASYTHGDRNQDAFHVDDYLGLTQRPATPGLFDSTAMLEQPGLRRYDVADRVQDRAGAELSYALGERADLTGTYQYLRNDFGSDTLLGLQEERVHSAAGAATLHLGERLDLSGGGGVNLTRSDQRSRTSSSSSLSFSAANNWSALLEEEETFAFGSVDWNPASRWNFGLDYTFTRSHTTFDLANGTNDAVDLPAVNFHRHELLAETGWQWQERTAIIGRWGWEEYDTNDWATTNVPLIFPVTGSASAIFLGDSSIPYRAHRVALLIRHTF